QPLDFLKPTRPLIVPQRICSNDVQVGTFRSEQPPVERQRTPCARRTSAAKPCSTRRDSGMSSGSAGGASPVVESPVVESPVAGAESGGAADGDGPASSGPVSGGCPVAGGGEAPGGGACPAGSSGALSRFRPGPGRVRSDRSTGEGAAVRARTAFTGADRRAGAFSAAAARAVVAASVVVAA